ncbi:MAG TPA: glycosyl hydrolase [Verrucomicrobiae bacterium]
MIFKHIVEIAQAFACVNRVALTVLFASCVAPSFADAAEIIRVGAGSYTTTLPAGAKTPPEKIYRTENARAKMPSNDWWSSLAWTSNHFAHFPHPLAMRVEPSGLRIFFPNHITANKAGIFGAMASGTNDFILGHSDESHFSETLVDGWSDWFVALRFGSAGKTLRVSYGHGSPFVYALYEGGSPKLYFPQPPKIWSGDASTAVLGLTVNEKSYALFGATGSHWTGFGSATLQNASAGKAYFSIALLPDNRAETLAFFKQYAYSHVADTRVAWTYQLQGSLVTTKFTFTTRAYEGGAAGTIFALYPHQWHNTKSPLLPYEFPSIRGPMKVGQGAEFSTEMIFPGVLPALPDAGGLNTERAIEALRTDFAKPVTGIHDTYWSGKVLGKLAAALPIADQYKIDASDLRTRLSSMLENWLSADKSAANNRSGLFYYDTNWGTLIGYPASYGSDTELNDHHFHYGYFIKGAAELARVDPEWAAKWGGMIELLIRDIASPSHEDALFPFLRALDPYAGHSWASGHARFHDGNNNESSSEAMNAWAGIILWGEATGNKPLRDLGIWLFTTEMNAINEYWFDAQRRNFPPSYPASVMTMVWGGKGANATWFSANPEAVHGINFLPMHGGSLYLGLFPDYCARNYQALEAENKGTNWDAWADIIYMYRALSNPDDAIAQFEASAGKYPSEGGNSRLNTMHWIYNLKQLGHVDRTVTADTPLYAVFRSGDKRSYVAYSMRSEPQTVTFSDGFKLQTSGKGLVKGARQMAR